MPSCYVYTYGEVERLSRLTRRAIIAQFGAGRHGCHTLDDLTHEVLSRLYADDARLLREYDPGRSGFKTYLARIVRSAVVDVLRGPSLETDVITASTLGLHLMWPHH